MEYDRRKTDEHLNAVEGRLVSVEATVNRIKVDLYNGDNSPETGLVPELRAYLKNEAQRRWKRSDKIAFAAFLVLLLAWPAAQAYDFVHTVWEITQEWHLENQKSLHHSFFNSKPDSDQQMTDSR